MRVLVSVAWAGLGGGWLPDGPGREGTCGMCGRSGRVWAALGVVSARFSSWELVRTDPASGRRWVCGACAWALASPGGVRRWCVVVGREGVGVVEWWQVGDLLCRGGLGAGVGVVVPAGGVKAVLPFVRGGCVASDPGVIEWGGVQARALRAARFVRSMGAGERELVGACPPERVLAGLGAGERARVRAAWRVWAPLGVSLWGPVLARATRPAPDSSGTASGKECGL